MAETGAVNAGVPGSYSLGYAATDPSGNVGVASRVVNVSDTTAPAIDVVDLTILAKGLTIVVNDGTLTIGGLSFPLNRSGQFNVDGHTVTFEGGSSPWTASRRSRAAAPSCCCRRTTTTTRSPSRTSSPA